MIYCAKKKSVQFVVLPDALYRVLFRFVNVLVQVYSYAHSKRTIDALPQPLLTRSDCWEPVLAQMDTPAGCRRPSGMSSVRRSSSPAHPMRPGNLRTDRSATYLECICRLTCIDTRPARIVYNPIHPLLRGSP